MKRCIQNLKFLTSGEGQSGHDKRYLQDTVEQEEEARSMSEQLKLPVERRERGNSPA